MSSKPIAQDEGAPHGLAPHTSEKPAISAVTGAAGEADAARDPAAMLKSILADVLGISREDAEALNRESGLFGHLPELDSMAVAGLLTEIEDRYDIVIEDDDVDGEMLETFGGLLDFIVAKTEQA